jgi:hypothetical protein
LAIAVAFERLLVIGGMSSSPNNPSLPTVTFVPYNPETIIRNGRTSTVAARINHKNKSIPTNALHCVQVKAIEVSIICCCSPITICGNCGSFALEKIDH